MWGEGIETFEKTERGMATGKISLDDPQAVNARMTNLMVGLTAPDYTLPNGEKVDWQKDARSYQFWIRAGENGTFNIPNVLPGKYTLHAFADGVLGEFSKTDITITPEQTV